jgi:hypothetical protein
LGVERKFNRPPGTEIRFSGPFYPVMNRWAILKRPSGTGQP